MKEPVLGGAVRLALVAAAVEVAVVVLVVVLAATVLDGVVVVPLEWQCPWQ